MRHGEQRKITTPFEPYCGKMRARFERSRIHGEDMMEKMPTMLDVMTPAPLTIEVGSSLKQARAIMASHGIRHLPVTAVGRLVGLLTDRDMKFALAVGAGVADADNVKVEDVCLDEPYSVEHSARLDQVLKTMGDLHIGSALVLRSGKLVGIFTLVDAAKKLCEILPQMYPDA
jgi:acetoin utilization protein AcuB